MGWKEFFKPTKRKIIYTIILFAVIFLVPYSKIGGEIFQGGYIRIPLLLVLVTYIASGLPDFIIGITVLEILTYLLALLALVFATYTISCFLDIKLAVKK